MGNTEYQFMKILTLTSAKKLADNDSINVQSLKISGETKSVLPPTLGMMLKPFVEHV